MERYRYTPPFDTVEGARRARENLGPDPSLSGSRWALQVYSPSRDAWVVWGRPASVEGERALIRELRGRRWRYRVPR